MPIYQASEIGVAVTTKEVCDALNGTTSGSYAYIHRYQDKKGNVTSQLIRSGINYGNVKARSVATLKELEDKPGDLEVTFHTWIDDKKVCHSRQAKGRLFSNETRTVAWDDPRVVAAIKAIRDGILHPKETGKADYQKEAKGLYALDDKLYVRDALQLNSVYHEVESEQAKATLEAEGVKTRPSATDLEGGIKKAIKKLIPYGYYRTFFFDLGKFAYIAIGGITFLSNEQGEVFQTLPEYAKEFAEVSILT